MEFDPLSQKEASAISDIQKNEDQLGLNTSRSSENVVSSEEGSNRDSLNSDEFEKVEHDQLLQMDYSASKDKANILDEDDPPSYEESPVVERPSQLLDFDPNPISPIQEENLAISQLPEHVSPSLPEPLVAGAEIKSEPRVRFDDSNIVIPPAEIQETTDILLGESDMDKIPPQMDEVNEKVEAVFSPPPRERTPSPPAKEDTPPRQRSPSPPKPPTPPRQRSPSPLRQRSPSPPRHRTPSPPRQRTPSPIRELSPPRQRSPSPLKLPTPPRQRTPSPPRELTPPRQRSPSPIKEPTPPVQRSPSPPRREPFGELKEAEVAPVYKEMTKMEPLAKRNVSVAGTALDPLRNLIYWRDIKQSGIVFGATMVVLMSLAYLSLISVVAYTSLAVLVGTLSFRIYKNIMQAVQKSQDGHPFKQYLEYDTTVSPERAQEITDVAVEQFNCAVRELKRLFLVEDLIDSVKFCCLLWCLTYVGSWFNGLTLVILGVVSLFTLPKVYEQNQAVVDQYLGIVSAQYNEISNKIRAAIPIGNKEKAQ